ncbi:hypothetical protein GBA52_011747 [Prunus armeniaca]|nr:hypothetical protein GBA52_011747 [Prunus armeniaca]
MVSLSSLNAHPVIPLLQSLSAPPMKGLETSNNSTAAQMATTMTWLLFSLPLMRCSHLTVGELADAKLPVVTLRGIETVERIVEVLRNTTHNGFPVIDDGVVPPVGLAVGATEVHGLILRAHLVHVLKKKWFQREKRRTEEWEVREKFTWVELAEREGKIEEVAVTSEEMEMYVDLHPSLIQHLIQ